MTRQKITNVKPGMVLGEDIYQGRNVLLSKGQVLDNHLIEILQRREIPEVLIQEAEQDKDNETGAQAKEEMPSTSPNISVQVANDRMSVSVTIETRSSDDTPLTTDMVKEALILGNVLTGYLDSEIQNVIKKFNANKNKIENAVVARGQPAKPGTQGRLDISYLHVKNPEDYMKVSSVKYAAEVPEIVKLGSRVDEGTVIAVRTKDEPPQLGFDVLGQEIHTDEILPLAIKTGINVVSESQDTEFKSTVTGVVCYVEETLSVFPLNFDSMPKLSISTDKMQATLSILPPSEGGKPLDAKQIKDMLAENKIVFGILEPEIAQAISEAEAGKYPEDVVVAKGMAPVNGTDGKIDFLVDISSMGKPERAKDGSVDYKNLNLVVAVVKGQELAKLVLPEKGKTGTNVLGEELPCTDSAPAQLPVGANTAPKEDDDQVLVATAAGNARWNGQVIDIQEGLVIPGDIDMSTGNIKYDHSVSIKGDIKAGFAVEVGGDLEVDGTVEDAAIECGGNVLVKGGLLGSGKGCIKAKQNVSVAFVQNQEIRAGQDIFVAREAIGAVLGAKRNIEAMGTPFSIVGGQVTAGNEIKAYAIGNEQNVRTNVEVGLDVTLVEEQAKVSQEIVELREKRHQFMAGLQRFRHMVSVKKKLQPEEEALFQKLQQAEQTADTQITALQKKREIIAKKLLEVGKARIIVEHAIFPGAVIKIRERNMVVDKEIAGPKTITYDKGKIRVA